MGNEWRPTVRLVVLNYDGGQNVLRCLEQLERLDWPRDRLDIVVVDNDSRDDSDREIEALFPDVRLIRTGSNLGFPGNNAALRDLDGVDFVGLVNNDAFVEPGWLSPLVAALETDPGLGAVCPKIVFDDRFVPIEIEATTMTVPGDPRILGVRVSGVRVRGTDRLAKCVFLDGFYFSEAGPPGEPEFRWTSASATLAVPIGTDGIPAGRLEVRVAGIPGSSLSLRAGGPQVCVDVGLEPKWIVVPTSTGAVDIVNNAGSRLVAGGYGGDRGFRQIDAGQFDEGAEVFAWCGAGVLFRPSYLADVGLFDERFFMYYEDTDLSWRGRARGWRYRFVPEAQQRHVHAASTGEWTPMFRHYVERNRLLMLVKNAPWKLAAGETTRFLASTTKLATRSLAGSLVRRRKPALGLARSRFRSFGGFLRLLPSMLIERRRLRRRQTVADSDLIVWMEPA